MSNRENPKPSAPLLTVDDCGPLGLVWEDSTETSASSTEHYTTFPDWTAVAKIHFYSGNQKWGVIRQIAELPSFPGLEPVRLNALHIALTAGLIVRYTTFAQYPRGLERPPLNWETALPQRTPPESRAWRAVKHDCPAGEHDIRTCPTAWSWERVGGVSKQWLTHRRMTDRAAVQG